MHIDSSLLEAAIVGYGQQRSQIDDKIAALRAELGQVSPPAEHPRRKLSAAGRRAIQEAGRRRWAAFRASKAQAPKKAEAPARTHVISAAGRKAIAKAQRAPWAKARAAKSKQKSMSAAG